MSFGKRGSTNKKARQFQETNRTPRNAQAETGADDKLLRQILRILGVFVVCFVGYRFVLPEILALTFGHPVTGFVPPRSPEGRALRQQAIDQALAVRAPEIRRVEIRLDDVCMPAGAQTIHTRLDKVEYWVDPESKWAPDSQDPRGQIEIKQAPEYLSCISKIERQRFCQPYFRTKFASQLRRYFESVATFNASAQKLRDFSRIAHAQYDASFRCDASNSDPQSACDIDRAVPTIGLDPIIIALVKDLSSNDYLAASNFGPFGSSVPKEIAPFMQPVSRKNCQ
ncbi:hypothetical protein [Methylocystis iwaonis]|uniref:hypothetical protein n=1 Tax=Methylocystis iwaonis TaxID=2885079 RepID=UPI002E7B76D7|nr:hypothetical protein [Methylocystis iwaonis]